MFLLAALVDFANGSRAVFWFAVVMSCLALVAAPAAEGGKK
jgi:hypothetical protein